MKTLKLLAGFSLAIAFSWLAVLGAYHLISTAVVIVQNFTVLF